MVALDTSPEIWAMMLRLHQRRSPEERLLLACQLSEEVRELARCGIRARHPGYSEVEVEWARRRHELGDAVFCAAWPAAPRLEP